MTAERQERKKAITTEEGRAELKTNMEHDRLVQKGILPGVWAMEEHLQSQCNIPASIYSMGQ